jgi:hypothetical protein
VLSACGSPDADDAGNFAESYGERHKRAGEHLEFWGCQPTDDAEERDFYCDVVYRPLRGLRLDLVVEGDSFKVSRVRSGIRPGLELPGLTD